jgi:hypothetical protein
MVYRFRPVVVQIDLGALQRMEWGSRFFAQPPGRHTVRVYIEGAIFGAEIAANSIDILVEEGKVTRVTYQAPVWAWQVKGTIKGEVPALAGLFQSAMLPAPAPPFAAGTPQRAVNTGGAPGQQVGTATVTGVTCAQCGAPSVPGARFCQACGTALPQPRACPACGQQQTDGKFCSGCGTRLGD